MSDAKAQEYYPAATDLVMSMAWRPCFKCGAMINDPFLGLHVEWHERNAEG